MKFQVIVVAMVVFVIEVHGYGSTSFQKQPVERNYDNNFYQPKFKHNKYDRPFGNKVYSKPFDTLEYPFYTPKRNQYNPDDKIVFPTQNEYDYKIKFPSYPNDYITNDDTLLQTQAPVTVNEEFSYDDERDNGPSNWGRFSEVCETGNRQSPVNLIEDRAIQQPTQRPLIIEGFATQPTSMKVENNGHSAKFSFNHQNNKPIRFLGGPLKQAYNLDGIHFHWGPNDFSGSEHTIDYKRYSAEIHLVAWNSLYASLTEAMNKTNGLVVLGILYELDNDPGRGEEDNPFIKFLSLVQEPGSSHTEFEDVFSIRDLIKSLDFEYLSYKGSLTTPPCTETVTWLVSVDPLKMSSYELAQFRKIKDNEGKALKSNFRPLQRINYRRVLAY
ncbi:unnamed protein product [Diamesa serratosioi]